MTGSAPAADRSASILRVLALAALVGAAFVVITTARSVVQLWHPVVFWDQWAFVEDLQLQDRGAYGLAELWRQHNEHRILFPRLLFWVDFALFSGRGVFPIGATAALQLALVVTLVRLGARAGTRAAGTTLLHCALAIAGAASSAQMNNLFWGFQVQFAGVYCAAAMAIAALARNGGAAAIALASLLGVVASGMMANGIAIWPLLCVLAWFQRRPYRQVVTLAAIGTATVACYLHGYGSPGAHANPVTSVTEHLPQVLAFVLGYVGSPMRGFGFRACATAGALGLVVLGALAFGILRRRDPARAPAALCAACLFTIGSGFMTALGRIGLEDGTASRYSTSAFLFWSALGGLALARV
ncbi:MAG TPA: hypothetical protein VK348_11655, partial [Planctomycetota bacterium]|nr:hypothetical protein [Planctomycetota bacterium]